MLLFALVILSLSPILQKVQFMLSTRFLFMLMDRECGCQFVIN